jgi:thiamine pyrophosphate-dependent acetolactate synthase large subunit-like protein
VVESRDELHSALSDSIAAESPQVIEVPVAPGMHLF